jgi:hypothetical protein
LRLSAVEIKEDSLDSNWRGLAAAPERTGSGRRPRIGRATDRRYLGENTMALLTTPPPSAAEIATAEPGTA